MILNKDEAPILLQKSISDIYVRNKGLKQDELVGFEQFNISQKVRVSD